MQRYSLALSDIVVPERLRLDYGDVDDLAHSIRRYGLIQPIIVTQDRVLIAGGRRLRAHQVLKLDRIDVVYRETLLESERLQLELEENVRRKDMDWKERVRGISAVHMARRHDAVLAGDEWGYRQTGELLGTAHSHIGYCLEAADLLAKGDAEVAACGSLGDFIRLQLTRRETEANIELARRGLAGTGANGPVQHVVTAKPGLVTDLLGSAPTVATAPVVHSDDAVRPFEPYTANLSRWLYHGDVRSFFKDENYSDPAGDTIGYIITDPPYGIDVDNMDQEHAGMIDLDSVRAEHDVEQNLELLKEFVPLAYHHMRNSGSWLVMWADPWNWRWLAGLCEDAGFRVSRWPLTWIKTHACINTNAMKNFTKTVEFAVVAAKGNASLIAPQPVCHYACSNDETKKLLGHPYAKPLDLWKWLFKAFVPSGLAYFDPFIGRGSSALAAIDVGITPIGCEVNDTHYAHLYNNVRARYEQRFGKDKVTFT